MMRHIEYDVCVYELLNGRYPEILGEMLSDNFFIIQDKFYDFFYEITYFGDVVGFICGNIFEDKIFSEMAYIIKRYRNLGLFCKGLESLDNIFEGELVLFLPNHFTILSLIHNSLAIRLNSRLVVSRYRLCFDIKYSDERVYSFLYDLDNCCIVSLRREVVSPLLDLDLFSLGFEREVIHEEYFRRIYDELFGLM